MGAHTLSTVLGRRTGLPCEQRICQRCDQQANGDERHLLYKCPAVQDTRDSFVALCTADCRTMQQFMWQRDVVGVAHIFMECFAMLDSPDDDDKNPSIQP